MPAPITANPAPSAAPKPVKLAASAACNKVDSNIIFTFN
jgi:hypothetical protein